MFEQHPNQTLSSRPYEVYDAVCPSTTTEPDGKEDQDAGNTNSEEEILASKFPVVPGHSTAALTLPND